MTTMTPTVKLAVVLAAGLALAPAVRAQAPAARAQAPAFTDQLFAEAAAAAGMAEVAASQMAEARGADAETKKFAQQMVAEHSKANSELMAMAAAKRLPLPRTLSYQDQAAGAALAGLRGVDFDREYAKNQLAAHICAVQLFTTEADRGQDPEVKAWAAKTLPHLKGHLQMAKKLVKEEMDKSASEHAK